MKAAELIPEKEEFWSLKAFLAHPQRMNGGRGLMRCSADILTSRLWICCSAIWSPHNQLK